MTWLCKVHRSDNCDHDPLECDARTKYPDEHRCTNTPTRRVLEPYGVKLYFCTQHYLEFKFKGVGTGRYA